MARYARSSGKEVGNLDRKAPGCVISRNSTFPAGAKRKDAKEPTHSRGVEIEIKTRKGRKKKYELFSIDHSLLPPVDLKRIVTNVL